MPKSLRQPTSMLVLFALTLLALPAFAQQTAIQKRGVTADSTYQYGELDQVNLFSGGLSVGIPIGGSYPVGPQLAFGLSLRYNSKVWEVLENQTCTSTVPPHPQIQYSLLVPDRTSNAGLGWLVTPGRLIPKGYFDNRSGFEVPENWTFLSSDGGQHALYPSLHGVPGQDGAQFSNDGTYLRMQLNPAGGCRSVAGGSGDCRSIEFPSGLVYEFRQFSGEWRLIRQRDRFGNRVDLDTAISGNSMTWTFTDSHNRKQVVNFVDGVVESVNLQSFGDTPSQTGSAFFDFEYETVQVTLPDHNLPTCNGIGPPIQAKLLKRVVQADNSYFEMTYYTNPVDPLDGGLKTLRLPTDGKLAWVYGLGNYTPAAEIIGVINYVPETTTWQVSERNHFLRSGDASPLATWNYMYGDSGGIYASPTDETNGIRCYSQTTVIDPLGNYSDHYFATHRVNAGLRHEYGLPFTRCDPATGAFSANGPFLSSEIRQGDLNILRKTYVAYDLRPASGFDGSQDTNSRVIYSSVDFEDDAGKFQESVFEDFDGFGNWHTVVSGGNFGSVKTVQTDYLSGILGVNWSLPSNNTPWIHGLWSERRISEGSQTFKTQACFDSGTGFLEATRTMAGSATQAKDVFSAMSATFDGFVDQIETWGGDDEDSLPGSVCTRPSGTSKFKVANTYDRGVLKTSHWLDPSDDTQVVSITERVIDAATGLPSQVFDVSGLATDLAYDSLGRLTEEYEQDGAWTTYRYGFSTVNNPTVYPASVNTEICAYGQTNCARSTKLASRHKEFDGLGRLLREVKSIPLENDPQADNERSLTYNSVGWVVGEKTWDSDLNTITSGHDRFGRPAEINPPGVTTEPTAFSYRGERLVHRKVRIELAGGMSDNWITEERDHHGRLIAVCEGQSQAPGSSWSCATGTEGVEWTTYGYDAADRLTSVCSHRIGNSCGQTRSFVYDGRGFLLSETHPEIGAFGNSQKTYTYDALGHALTSHVDGGNGFLPIDLVMRYDRAGRPIGIDQIENSVTKPLKEFFYGWENGLTERRRGKLILAKRHNWLDPLGPVALALGGIDVIVTDSFRYFGKGGRISTKTTDLTLNVTTEAWESMYEYDDLGQVTNMSYPRALSWPYNKKAPDRLIQNSYKQGYLTAVAGYSPEITYQYGGMIREVDYQNNAKWTVDVNGSDKLARPFRINTLGVANGYQSGDMFYDGVGNVTTIGSLAYRYDRLSRLTSGQAPLNGVGLTQTASYDPYGNLLNLVTNGTAETMSPAAATNRLANATYDPAGNLTNINLGGNIKYGYDGLNAQASVQTTTKSRLQFYDANDDRIWTWDCPVGVCAGTHEAWTLRGLGGEVLRRYEGPNRYETTWKEDYVYRGATLLAMVQRLEPTGGPTEKIVNVFVDHLGSTRQTFDTANVAIDRFDFYPFGQETAPATTADPVHKFTGHERDAGLSHVKGTVDYMHARMCSPVTGRFLSVDPQIMIKRSILKPQAWNRYQYAENNPLNLVDPSGMYVTTCGNDKQCQANAATFEQARQELLKSGDPMLEAAASAYGDPGVDNGVVVSFAVVTNGQNRAAEIKIRNGNFNLDTGKMPIDAQATFDPSQTGTAYEANIAHEGQHIVNALAFLNTFQFDSAANKLTYDNSLNLTMYHLEVAAYQVVHRVGVWRQSTIETCPGGCRVGAGVGPKSIQKAIDKHLASSPNYNVTPANQGPRQIPYWP